MAYYPVKDDGVTPGTRTAAGYTAKQTGSFATLGAAGYYPSITAAITAGAGAGDVMQVSDAHAFDNVTTVMAYVGPLGAGVPLTCISVSDAAMETASVGAKEETNQNINIQGNIVFWGITLDTNTRVQVSLNENIICRLEKATVNLTSSNDWLGPGVDGAILELIDTTLNSSDATSYMRMNGGGNTIRMIGGSFTGTSTNGVIGQIGNGGGTCELIGVDLSNVSTTGHVITGHGASQNNDDTLQVTMHKCKLPGGSFGWIEETLTSPNTSVLATECESVSGDSEWQLYYQDIYGTVEAFPDNISGGIVRNTGGATFDGGRKVAYKFVSTAYTNVLTPLDLEIPVKFCELSNAATDKIRIYFTSTTALKDTDCWVEVTYMNSINKQTPTFYSSKNANPMLETGGGTAHTNDTGSDWEDNGVDLTGYNEYYIEVDTSTIGAGADGVPVITFCLGLASATVFVDSEIGLVA